MNQPRSWISFWNAPHAIYANARHLDVHYQLVAEHVAGIIAREAPESRGSVCVLDYGCGEALHAGTIAEQSARLLLCDAAPRVRETLARRFVGQPKIAVLSPEEVAQLDAGSLDFIVMVSVAQYIEPSEFDRLLVLFRRLLRGEGRLVIGDVVPPSVSPVVDALALLRLARRNGFLGAALLGLARTAVSDYRKLRAAIGLAHYTQDEMVAKLAQAGFKAQRTATNIGHNQARMTFVATPE